MQKNFIILTLFPNMFNDFMGTSIIKRALEKKIITIKIVDIRAYSDLKHHQVDDYQYGGGEGMVLMAPPVVKAIQANKTAGMTVILLTPQGQTLKQSLSQSLASNNNDLMLICGHYEGFDERIRDYVDFELSIGDYILTGGELASMVIIDSVTRLCTDVINENSHQNDSFSNQLLDYPVYTKPLIFEGKEVPDVLLSGHHQNIADWRRYQALKRTYLRRPDLLENLTLTKQEEDWLAEIKNKDK
ncbi:tRNA (guanosine(37)-N1)-methyltransferase TrmD [Spiroplasma sp. DGKH1]|uniref:tRNA (guanosine(37)-N1)-methyltransferase TrmD n=1 Tax=Spiroplasma sp. DGKH1 TaxID=3050074 RepID=UPI0034C62D98